MMPPVQPTIDYATPDPRRRMTWRRLLLLTLYYGGWSIGGAIVVIVGLVAAVNIVGGSFAPEWAIAAGIPGAAAGAGLAYAARPARWPQFALIVAGIAAMGFFGYHAVGEYFGPRGFLWGLVFTIALVLCGCGGAAVLGGAAGLILIHRRPTGR